MPQRNSPPPKGSKLISRELLKPQRTAVIFLSALAVLIVVFWVWQFRAQINRPFIYGPGDKKAATDIATADIDYILKNNDTDADGLSNYDELYVYKTSPYLEDTDSDGLSDKQEIEQGTDPNCPRGKNCNIPVETATSSQQSVIQPVIQPEITLPENLGAAGINEAILQNALSGQIDAATLRQLLIAAGADPETLNKISDEDLMKSYQESLNKQSQD